MLRVGAKRWEAQGATQSPKSRTNTKVESKHYSLAPMFRVGAKRWEAPPQIRLKERHNPPNPVQILKSKVNIIS